MHFVQAKRLLSKDNGMNIYRGCSHGCIYCDSRSRCYGFTHAFEDIEVRSEERRVGKECRSRWSPYH